MPLRELGLPRDGGLLPAVLELLQRSHGTLTVEDVFRLAREGDLGAGA